MTRDVRRIEAVLAEVWQAGYDAAADTCPYSAPHSQVKALNPYRVIPPLVCNADGIPHEAHEWDFGSGETFACPGFKWDIPPGQG